MCLPLLALSQGVSRKYPVSQTKALEIVASAIRSTPIIDGHNDLLRYYYDCKSCPRDLNHYRLDTIAEGHTDIVRWKKGSVGCQVLNVFGDNYTARNLLDAYDLVYRMTGKYRNDLVLATSSSDIRMARAGGAGVGNIFKIATDGTGFVVLHNLVTVADGS